MRNISLIPLGRNIAAFLFFIITGCTKFVTVDPPPTATTGDAVYSDDVTAIAAITNLYVQLSSNQVNATNLCSLSLLGGLSADEFTLWSGGTDLQKAYYRNSLLAPQSLSIDGYGSEFYQNIYSTPIYICNAAIEGLTNSNKLTASVKQQLLGEAKFIRAFYYFYLVNLYGDVPLVLTTDFSVNRLLSRAPKSAVYQQIISDLKDAERLLSANYVDGTLIKITTERVRPNKVVAEALLARVYLYAGYFAEAESESSLVINNALYSLAALNAVFLKNSNEAIWQVQSANNGVNSNTFEAPLFNISFTGAGGFSPGVNSTHPVYLSASILNSFEPNDQRKVNLNWVNSFTDPTGTYYYAYKYKATSTGTVPATEYRMILRLAEQYLIRAEARAMQANLQGAIDDVNFVRLKHGGFTSPLPLPINQMGALATIDHERQVELFTEWGDRWLNMKRRGTVDAVMGVGGACAAKGGSWNSYQQLYPLPAYDLLKDINLIQNPGY